MNCPTNPQCLGHELKAVILSRIHFETFCFTFSLRWLWMWATDDEKRIVCACVRLPLCNWIDFKCSTPWESFSTQLKQFPHFHKWTYFALMLCFCFLQFVCCECVCVPLSGFCSYIFKRAELTRLVADQVARVVTSTVRGRSAAGDRCRFSSSFASFILSFRQQNDVRWSTAICLVCTRAFSFGLSSVLSKCACSVAKYVLDAQWLRHHRCRSGKERWKEPPKCDHQKHLCANDTEFQLVDAWAIIAQNKGVFRRMFGFWDFSRSRNSGQKNRSRKRLAVCVIEIRPKQTNQTIIKTINWKCKLKANTFLFVFLGAKWKVRSLSMCMQRSSWT